MSECYIKETMIIIAIWFIEYANVLKINQIQKMFQEIFIKIIEKITTFLNENHRKAWIITLTINHCKNILKKKTYTKQ